jgi:hypothetical protein
MVQEAVRESRQSLFADAPAIIGRLNFDEPKRRVVGGLVDALRARELECQGLVIDALVELAQYDPTFPNLARGGRLALTNGDR